MQPSKKPLISIVSPVYLAENLVDPLVQEISNHISIITEDYEILLIEDGSPDNSWEKIKTASEKDSKIKGLKLSRNFGQHYAITAGLAHSSGDYVIVLDCDLQHHPRYFPKLYEKALEGYDIVYAKKEKRVHKVWKNIATRIFYALINFLGGVKLDPNIGTYSILSRKAVDAFLRFKDYQRAYLFILTWVGFSSSYIITKHDERRNGKSSYTFSKLLRLGINYSLAYTDRLLYLIIYLGFIIGLFSFIGILIIIFKYFTDGFLEGWPSIMVTIAFFSGIIITSIGVAGIYIGKIFEQAKERPLYLIDQKINFEPTPAPSRFSGLCRTEAENSKINQME
jgi:glycosyltransferase involved in cell wall biosynthesis